MKDLKKYLAEFIGTCILVLFGCGTAIGSSNYVATAFAFGNIASFLRQYRIYFIVFYADCL